MRLIDADALIKWINDSRCADCPDNKEDRCAACQWDDAIMSIETAPTIATDTNVLGKWIKLEGMAPPEFHGHKICSICECLAPYDPIHQWREALSRYCPGCGAKMEVQDEAD